VDRPAFAPRRFLRFRHPRPLPPGPPRTSTASGPVGDGFGSGCLCTKLCRTTFTTAFASGRRKPRRINRNPAGKPTWAPPLRLRTPKIAAAGTQSVPRGIVHQFYCGVNICFTGLTGLRALRPVIPAAPCWAINAIKICVLTSLPMPANTPLSFESKGTKAPSQVVRGRQLGWLLGYQSGALIQSASSTNQLANELGRSGGNSITTFRA
jgi:hypothetical protein